MSAATTKKHNERGATGAPLDRLQATLALDEPVSRVKLVSPVRAQALAKLGISSVRQLVTHFPRRYIDLSSKETVASAVIGQQCTIEGVVHEIQLKRPKPRLNLVEITVIDGTGTLMVTAFRQPWLMEQVHAGDRVAVAGELEFNFGFKRMTNPYLEVLIGSDIAQGMIIPVHPACEKISPAWMRRLVSNALAHVQGVYDPLPLDLRAKYRLMSKGAALRSIHFPHSMDDVAQARRRLVYEELLLLELTLMSQNKQREAGCAPVVHATNGAHISALAEVLPFRLTEEQEQAKNDILRRMAAPSVMNHMLLGDVGTGKTAVAAFALAAVADTGTQAFLMAPTEVLAQQHAASLEPLFNAAGVTWELLTGSTSALDRETILQRFAAGTVDVLIGTHALLEDDVAPRCLSLVVVDEQQRFGVDQRSRLLEKGQAPDALYLTATPIPRSLALALYGNLTLSYIKHRPHASAVRTTFVHQKSNKGRAYDAARVALAQGQQAFVVCPLIGQNTEERNRKAKAASTRAVDEETYEYALISIEDDADFQEGNVTAATQEAEYLQAVVFADYRVALLHGRMSSAEKQQVMREFQQGDIQVLVATTVIEVGVDVPNATVMIVEDADRFGLSQLHQLRGRVGRGTLPAQVHLISASKSPQALARLQAMEQTDDGFELAAYDLSLRREGDILGNRQHGASALKLVNVIRDGKIIEAAHADAEAIIQADPLLELPQNKALAREARAAFADAAKVQGG